MAISIKTESEIKSMREGGKILAATLEEVCKRAQPGVSTWELDQFAEKFIRKHNAIPGFKGYHGFPATLCTAIDEVVVHGIPGKNQILKEGDLFTVDCGVLFEGLNTDAAKSIGIGKISNEKEKLLKVAKEALSKAIDIAKPGIRVNEIGKSIETTVKNAGFHIIKDLTGHGIGRDLHEEPIILNYEDRTPGAILKEGMTIAIEPIFAISTGKIKELSDNWTLVTMDGSASVQEENTILITRNGNEILTSP